MPETPKSNPPIDAVPVLPKKAEHAGKSAVRRTKHKVDIFVLLRALKKRWWQAALLGTILASLVGTAIWFLVPLASPLVYARVQIRESSGGNWQGNSDPPLQRQTQVLLIKDPVTLTAVLRRPEVAQLSIIREQDEPEEWLMKQLRVEFPGPDLMQFSMSGDHPQDLKVLVNAVRAVFLQNYGDTTRADREAKLKNLQDYYMETKARIDTLYEQLRKKAESGHDVDKDAIILKLKLNMELLEHTEKEIINKRADLRQYRTELKIALENTGSTTVIPTKLIEDALVQHPSLQPMMSRYAEMQDLLEKTKQAAPANSHVATLQKELDELRKQYDAKKKEIQPIVLAELKKKYDLDRDSLIAKMKEKVYQLEETEKVLTADADRLAKQSKSLNTTTIQLEEERQQITNLEAIRASVANAIEKLRAEKDAPERIKSLNDPVISLIDKYSNKIRFSILASLAAFLLALLLVAYLESRTRRINSAEDVLDQFGLNVVGMVPAPPKRLGLAFGGKKTENEIWQNLLTESVDAFRTQLLFKARANSHQILMISSADSGEGKTSLACHLALSLARSGLKTLLIDADLRNPTVHELFELPLEPGLSEVIREVIPVEDALHRTSAAGLWLIPAGVCSRRVIELLPQDRLNHVFSKLRQQFDFVIVDSSPIMPVADPLLIAQHTDGVIFSLMQQVSRYSAVRESVEKLNSLNIQTLGAVINGTQTSRGYHNRNYAYRTMND